MHFGCCSTFGKRKNTLACGSCFYAFLKSRNIARAWITLSCPENHSVTLYAGEGWGTLSIDKRRRLGVEKNSESK